MIWTVVLVWTVTAAVIAAGVWKLARQQRGEALLPGAYRGRHRARGLSTMQHGQLWAAVQARGASREHLELVTPAGVLPTVEPVAGPPVAVLPVPRPRSPWGTPEWVDEWTGEHDPVPVRAAA